LLFRRTRYCRPGFGIATPEGQWQRLRDPDRCFGWDRWWKINGPVGLASRDVGGGTMLHLVDLRPVPARDSTACSSN